MANALVVVVDHPAQTLDFFRPAQSLNQQVTLVGRVCQLRPFNTKKHWLRNEPNLSKSFARLLPVH